jgi:hypothetical protein
MEALWLNVRECHGPSQTICAFRNQVAQTGALK